MNKLKKCRHGEMLYQTTDLYVGKSFDLYGEFSEGEVALFEKIVAPGHVVLDVGANIGAHTIPLAQLTGPRGGVLAFEPQRIPYYTLCANVVLNNLHHVICYQAALGDKAGRIVVPDLDYSVEQNFGGLGLANLPPDCRGHIVPLLRIDDLKLPRCNFIKIDVEGMERSVLSGAVETIRRFKPILYVEDDRKEKSAELRAFLESLGYFMFLHRPPLYNPDNFAHNPQNVFNNIVSLNLYCHHRETLSPINPLEYHMVPVHAGGPSITLTAPV
ncbi:MAG TPA: FkbM family methyltransferase [Gemmataceae bacterium]|jgi:FkbM family methyltransferase|nr:FkbM family methyltransferase [Gemmataceae bacterium]